MTVRPRTLVFGGRIEAVAIWIDRALAGELESRRRVLSLHRETARVLEVAGGYLCHFGAAHVVDADLVEGVVIASRGPVLFAAPLRPVELDATAAPTGALILVRAGVARVHAPSESKPVDVSTWLDVSAFAIHPTAPMGAEPERVTPRLVGAAPSDVRTILGDTVPPPAKERAEIFAALSDRDVAPTERGEGLFARLRRWLATPPSDARALPPAPAGAPGSVLPTEPGPVTRLLRRLVLGSPLAAALGRRQARYLQRMLEMFDRADFDAALRHAIPFSSKPGTPKPPTLGVPSARAELRLRERSGPSAATAYNLPADVYARFQAVYQRAARELEKAGRIDEAAFVYFELLEQYDEGIAMLERHGRYELAAKLAEGREMAPGLVIRLWFLAGKPARAILVARRTGAYADAIARLERSHPELAGSLRVLWAHRLATAGDYAAAVDAVWPIERARALATEWVDRAIAFGGPTGCRMLAKKLALWPGVPAPQQQVRAAVADILADPSVDGVRRRSELARAWADLPRPLPPLAPELARSIARRLMLDAEITGDEASARAMLTLAGDPVLRADAYNLDAPIVETPPSVHGPVFEAHERGLSAALHAVALEGGRFLLVLGDAGIRLVGPTGRVQRSWEQPADRIVLSESGSRAIAIARRGETRTLARIDLVTGARERWCDARYDLHAPGYDGATWFLSVDDAVVAVDAQSDGLDALWRVSGLPARPAALAWAPGRLAFAIRSGASDYEVWCYELGLGGPVLRHRRQVATSIDHEPVDGLELRVQLEAGGGLVLESVSPRSDRARRWLLSSPAEGGGTVERVVAENGLAFARAHHIDFIVHADDGVRLHRLGWKELAFRDPVVALLGVDEVGVHERGGVLTISDALGRIVQVAEDGRIVKALLV